jgi:reactive intermediate/imine deaminase
MPREIINSPGAPRAIGTYSQAVRAGDTVYISGQIGLDPASMQLAAGFDAQVRRVFANLAAVAEAAGGTLDDAVKLTVYLTNLENFSGVNDAMAEYFRQPYPARAAVGVSRLPKDALVEIDAILQLQI